MHVALFQLHLAKLMSPNWSAKFIPPLDMQLKLKLSDQGIKSSFSKFAIENAEEQHEEQNATEEPGKVTEPFQALLSVSENWDL